MLRTTSKPPTLEDFEGDLISVIPVNEGETNMNQKFDIKSIHTKTLVECVDKYNSELDEAIKYLQSLKVDKDDPDSLEYRMLLEKDSILLNEFSEPNSFEQNRLYTSHIALRNLIDCYSYTMEKMVRNQEAVFKNVEMASNPKYPGFYSEEYIRTNGVVLVEINGDKKNITLFDTGRTRIINRTVFLGKDEEGKLYYVLMKESNLEEVKDTPYYFMPITGSSFDDIRLEDLNVSDVILAQDSKGNWQLCIVESITESKNDSNVLEISCLKYNDTNEKIVVEVGDYENYFGLPINDCNELPFCVIGNVNIIMRSRGNFKVIFRRKLAGEMINHKDIPINIKGKFCQAKNVLIKNGIAKVTVKGSMGSRTKVFKVNFLNKDWFYLEDNYEFKKMDIVSFKDPRNNKDMIGIIESVEGNTCKVTDIKPVLTDNYYDEIQSFSLNGIDLRKIEGYDITKSDLCENIIFDGAKVGFYVNGVYKVGYVKELIYIKEDERYAFIIHVNEEVINDWEVTMYPENLKILSDDREEGN